MWRWSKIVNAIRDLLQCGGNVRSLDLEDTLARGRRDPCRGSDASILLQRLAILRLGPFHVELEWHGGLEVCWPSGITLSKKLFSCRDLVRLVLEGSENE
jgi:hypothetical protein